MCVCVYVLASRLKHTMNNSGADEKGVNPPPEYVTFRIDYCNSLLCGKADYSINWLQRIQNGAARIMEHSHAQLFGGQCLQ